MDRTMGPASFDAMRSEPERRMGAYSLLDPIGTGGMGAVHVARKRGIDDGERYAVKVMLPHLSGDDRFVSLFLHEARIATRVRHPNVCRVIDYGSEDGTYYIAMELLEGRTLAATIEQLVPVPASEARALRRVLLSIVADAAAGLEHAHELEDDVGRPLSVVHRDVCPSNVLVTERGVAKILDFGIALYADRSFLTTTGEMKGHLAYVAPEILAGMRADRTADVWSLAVVAWEVIAGRRLFRRDSEAATISAVLHDPVPRLSSELPDLPPALDAAIARGLERDRARRTTSTTELVRAILDALGTERASPGEIAQSLARWVAPDTEQHEVA
ncbi:MAG: serine/threonine protein kinase, partial [Myxococcota bacterium]|nr:serine/threonine protein kinase [Myxococcota bacterium]